LAGARENVPGQPVLARQVHDIDIMAGTSKGELSDLLVREINKAARIDPFAKVEMELRAKTGLLNRESAILQKPSGEVVLKQTSILDPYRRFGQVETDVMEPGLIDWHTHPADVFSQIDAARAGVPVEEILNIPSSNDMISYMETRVRQGRIITPTETLIIERGSSPSAYTITRYGKPSGWSMEVQEPATTMFTEREPVVSLRDGELVGPRGEKLFDIKSPRAAGEYGSPEGYVRYGMRQEGTTMTPERVQVMRFSEQMSRKAAAAMDQIRGERSEEHTSELQSLS
jgi:hypothetical protein